MRQRTLPAASCRALPLPTITILACPGELVA
jgi:hypothetical protein